MIKNHTKDKKDKIDKIVLVGVLKNKRDLNILLTEKWYRIPVAHAPRRQFNYLAFYQPALFGRQGKCIRYYARVLSSRNLKKSNSDSSQPSVEKLDQIGEGAETAQPRKNFVGCPKGDSARAKRVPIWNYQTIKRRDLLPDEPDHPRTHDYYFRVRVGKIKKLPRPIRNIIPRRVSFGFTTLNHLLKSKNILQLYNIAPTEQIVEHGLRRANIKAVAQYYVLSGKKRYCLDFAVFCKQGSIAVECDNIKAHSSLGQREKDKIKNTFLRRRGWTVIRLPEHDIVSDLESCIVRVKKAVRKLGGAL